jgi:hypothetical protein
VRRRTLFRPGEEPLSLVTDLLEATRDPAAAWLPSARARWGSERVFPQITEGFALRRLIGRTPPATVFQAAFCRLLSTLGQVLRG